MLNYYQFLSRFVFTIQFEKSTSCFVFQANELCQQVHLVVVEFLCFVLSFVVIFLRLYCFILFFLRIEKQTKLTKIIKTKLEKYHLRHRTQVVLSFILTILKPKIKIKKRYLKKKLFYSKIRIESISFLFLKNSSTFLIRLLKKKTSYFFFVLWEYSGVLLESYYLLPINLGVLLCRALQRL